MVLEDLIWQHCYIERLVYLLHKGKVFFTDIYSHYGGKEQFVDACEAMQKIIINIQSNKASNLHTKDLLDGSFSIMMNVMLGERVMRIYTRKLVELQVIKEFVDESIRKHGPPQALTEGKVIPMYWKCETYVKIHKKHFNDINKCVNDYNHPTSDSIQSYINDQ